VTVKTKEQRAVITNLKKARKILANPKRWTKGALFRTKGGNVGLDHDWFSSSAPKDAYMFCALGAITKANGEGQFQAQQTLARAISMLFYKRERLSADRVYRFNDKKSTTHDQILAAFDKALELAQAEADAAV
jgi:hypothetical protein